ncbi:hypothetical protein [Natrinema sp. DC36]|uniref:hypothetical protein n=1 Tax=Natrinema sp. DC36 TaxID=2878680 RepID=UPI001CEFB6F8|nr:hypothetical protein [Natrinema sp. DC36]
MRWLSGFETHQATITGDRQTGTEDDGYGGTKPVTETITVFEGWIRYESNGAGLARDFQGERSEDEPVVFIDGVDAVNDLGSINIREDDTLEIDGLEGTFEPRNIEPQFLDGSDPAIVLLNPVEVS